MTAADFNERIQARPTIPAGLLAAILLLVALIVLGAGIGSSFMSPQRVIAALLGQGSRPDELILWKMRLPRVFLAVTGGAALALAGAILQRVARNPLATPSILGITDGAAVGVVGFLWIYSNESNALIVSIHWLPLAAVAGAAALTLITGSLTLADRRRGPLGLILYGIAIAALAKALVTLLMIMGPVYLAGQAMTWLAGSVGAAHWSDVAILSAILVLSVPLIALAARVLAQLRLDPDSAAALMADYDLVLDGTDNFDTRYLVNRAAVAAGKPLISGALSQWEGQVSLFDPASGGPCYECIFPTAPAAGLAPSCAEAGVLGPLPGVVGTMMAVEAIKRITGAGQGLRAEMLIYDALWGETRKIALKRRADCPVCGLAHGTGQP